ncbi:serine--tRNA ligase [Candidatus Bipolaricaulota bacterium]|nr:serine--tRNA ligase [Candidatus Bipolaricaulota bacterium]
MIDIRLIREHREEIEKRLRTRDASIDLSEVLSHDERRRQLLSEVEELKAKRNAGSQEVAQRKQSGGDASELLKELSRISDRITELDLDLRDAEGEIERLLSLFPNVPHESVPIGGKEANVVLKTVGEKPDPAFPVRHHLEIAEEKGLLDFPRAARIAGARFPMYVGLGARMEMALIQFMFMHHADRGYTPILPPFLANSRSFYVASQLPKFADDIYYIEKDDLYLNPTAESLLVNLHCDEILGADELPKNYVAYTPCFRREAGSYGEEERGLIRVHQFNKVEMFKFATPESSYDELEILIADAERVLQALGMHYRIVLLASGDMAQQSSKTVDLEVYLPGQGRYYEVSSCSNCEAFQARRGNIRYRPGEKEKPRYVHTLNGSGLATSRLTAAILENNQTEDGRIRVPEVLQAMVGAEVL